MFLIYSLIKVIKSLFRYEPDKRDSWICLESATVHFLPNLIFATLPPAQFVNIRSKAAIDNIFILY